MSDLDHGPDEIAVSRLMHETAHLHDIDVERLVAGAKTRGVRKLRRRRMARLGAVCACLAMVVGSIALARPLLTDLTPDSGVVAGQPTAPDGSSNLNNSVDPTESAPAAQTGQLDFAVPTEQMASTLADLLPGEGAVSELKSWDLADDDAAPLYIASGSDPLNPIGSDVGNDFRAGSLVYDDGDGPALVSVAVTSPDVMNPGGALQDVESLCEGTATCSTVEAGRLVVLENHSDATRGGTQGIVATTAVLVTTDGHTITVTAYNAAQEKGLAPSRELPPFTAQQIADVATAGAWLA